MSILQWNIRSLSKNYGPGLKPLIDSLDPSVVCLQETKLSSKEHKLSGYTPYHHIHKENLVAAGGTSIFIKKNVLHRHLKLNTTLQAVAVRVTTYRPITICSLYLPPGTPFKIEQLLNLYAQLPTPHILLGDFNAHSPLWGDETLNSRGKIIEDFIAQTNLCILNDQSPTYVNPGTLNTTSVDLTLCCPEVASDLSWTTLDDLHHSDHYPIKIEKRSLNHASGLSRFNTKRADWPSFEADCSLYLNSENLETIEDFSTTLLDISNKNIPKTSTKTRKNKAWFNKDCQEAVKNKKKKLQAAQRNPTQANIKIFRIARANSRAVCRNAKKQSFKKYISKINNNTPMGEIFKIIKKLKGTNKDTIQQIQKLDGSFAETERDVAEEIGKSFAKNSSSENYSRPFQRLKQNSERNDINFNSQNSENYNDSFTYLEIENAIRDLSLTAPGPDGILNEILSHLPTVSIELLLKIFNNLWQTGSFPDEWREATIIPIPKPGKNHTEPSAYRPIALTNCVCKLMEKMVNKRLVWWLEKNEKLSKYQCGFRKNRSTLDHLIKLETYIRNAFINKEHVVAVFFDLEKAFDTTWKHGILKDLYNLGLRGNLPTFVKNFLSNRSFQVKVGSQLSDPFEQEEGVPQGSILSPILFEIKIDSITKTLKENIDCSLYVDDFLICYKSKSNIDTIERQLQLQLNKLENWANQNGFRFSPTKTHSVHFCCKRSCVREPELNIYNTRLRCENQARFLGLIFDKKLTFLPHLKDTKLRCQKALNILKILSNPEWGGDPEILLHLYHSTVRSKLDYGCQVYGSARKSYLKILDPIQNQGIRLALGAYRTSPEKSLHVEANEPPLELRRQRLSLQYAIKLSSLPDNPAHDCVFQIPDHINETVSRNENIIKPFGLRVQKNLKEINFSENDTLNHFTPETPFWQILNPEINLELSKLVKDKTDPQIYKNLFYDIVINQYNSYDRIYTDGSKDDVSVSSASVPFNSKISVQNQRIPSNASIFTAEANAIDIALNSIKKSENKCFLIITDSLSCLMALKSPETKNPIALKLKLKMHKFLSKNIKISFLLVPSHIGIDGNDLADELAKIGLSNKKIENMQIPYTDFKPTISKHFQGKWQDSWNEQTSNKLHTIQPKLRTRTSLGLSRRDGVKYTRLKLGHTHLTHSYLLKGEPPPFCVGCDKNLTIKHILTECVEFTEQREKFLRTRDIKIMFELLEPKKLISFLKETGLYKLL